MNDTLKGSCLCGDVRYEVRGPFPSLYQCHCSLCRKQGGSVSNTGLIVSADKFRWAAGEAGIGRWQRSSGFRSWFCARCGSTVPNPLRDTGYVWVPAGTLDDDAPFEVVAQLFLASRMACDRPRTDGLQFEEAPPMAELIAMLHGGSPGSSSR
ncbi:MAG TPA: GFA family protein [Steroidobacteraceae bacterium]|nr:GFA family protein [Steroidobacteraceae bacterium]